MPRCSKKAHLGPLFWIPDGAMYDNFSGAFLCRGVEPRHDEYVYWRQAPRVRAISGPGPMIFFQRNQQRSLGGAMGTVQLGRDRGEVLGVNGRMLNSLWRGHSRVLTDEDYALAATMHNCSVRIFIRRLHGLFQERVVVGHSD